MFHPWEWYAMASNGLIRSKKCATGRREMPGEHASCRRRLRLASRWYLYSKMLRDKMFLACVASTHHRARGEPEMMACLEGESHRGGVRLLTAMSQQRLQERSFYASIQSRSIYRNL